MSKKGYPLGFFRRQVLCHKGVLDELNLHQNPRGKSKIKINLRRRKIYQIKYLKDIINPKYYLEEYFNIAQSKYPQRKLWKESLFVQYEKNQDIRLLSATISIKSIPEGKKSSVYSLILVLRKLTVMMHGIFLHSTV